MNYGIEYATEQCITQYEYNESSTLATTTQSCYRPLDVYQSLGIDAIFFVGTIFILYYFLIGRRKKQNIIVTK